MDTYKIEKQYLEHITPHQREAMLADFQQDGSGDILIPYEHKGYTVNDFKMISELSPDGFVLEKVESILHPSNREVADIINENILRLGYHCSMLKMNAAEYGIPQKRKRFFSLASRKEINAALPGTHGSERECAENRRYS